MLVTDRRQASRPLPDLARKAIAGGVDLVQIRENDLDPVALRSLVGEVIETVGDAARIVVNGAVEIAAEYGIAVHLPEFGLPPADARAMLGPNPLIGRSVHSIKAANESEGADYVVVGHVFDSASKPGLSPLGLSGFRVIVHASPLPVIAIGGITGDNMESVLKTGAHGIAVISAINNAPDPENAARTIRARLDSWFNDAHPEGGKHMSIATTIDVTINGKQVALEAGTTISQFLQSKGLEERLVVVELNESILPRANYPSTILATGDRVEIVHFVGGG
jgi:thiamine-phosphate pyrophosphorylase